jgi:GNAT superfamily N-acetyltransferase
MQWQKDNYTITTNRAAFSIEYIHRYLSTQSYWAEGIPLQTVQKSVEGSLSFGVFCNDQMMGFARVITDKATFAYLADVFIDESFRGKGLSKWLMEVIMGHPDLQGLRRFMLATRDAHGLYSQYGFTGITNPERLMQIVRPDIYKTSQ